MKALQFLGDGQMQVVEMSIPEIKDDEVLVAARAVGICHSDIDLMNGRYILPLQFPVIPGHEWSGEVVRIGSAVTVLSVGDRVVGECVIAPQDHFGFSRDGAMSEYFVARPEWLHRIPLSIDDQSAALIETFTVAYNALLHVGDIDPSDLVAVLGAGPVGLMAVAAARAMGATVVCIEPQEARRSAAVSLGADLAVPPADAEAAIANMAGGRKPSVVLEASGRPGVMAGALELAGFEARIGFIGMSYGEKVPADLGLIQAKALKISGTRGAPGVWPRAIQFLERAQIDLSPLVTSTFTIDEAEEAIDASKDAQNNLKVVVAMESHL